MGLLKKIGRGIKKTVRKVVPKELSGIMTAAAPFVAPVSLPAAAALSIAGQLRTGQGRINPILTGASLLPGLKFSGSAQGLGRFVPRGFAGGPGGQDLISARQLFFGGPGMRESGVFGTLGDKAEGILFGTPEAGAFDREAGEFVIERGAKRGFLGTGGEFGFEEFTKGKLLSPTLDKTGKPILSKARVAGLVAAGASLATAQQQIEEEAIEAGVTSESTLDELKAEAAEIFKDFDTTAFRPNVAEGGLMRTNLAMGSRPTAQESGLGGLPIEADMRYTGGFMPYGAREKADDVPARLSKNEFVFTADAVRAAGGGNINKGARRMYNTMKQLESMGRA